MGPPPDPEDMVRMLQNPQFASTLSEALSDSRLVDTMIQQNPVLREMGPQVRQMLQSPEFRRMMTDPEQVRSMMQMQRMMGGGPFGSGGIGGVNSAFPAPGMTDTTPGSSQQEQPQQGEQRQAAVAAAPPARFNPYAAFAQAQGQGQGGGSQAAGTNPFAALFNPAMFGNPPIQTSPASAGQTTSSDQASSTTQSTSTSAPNNTTTTTQQQSPQFPAPFPNPMYNPQMLQQFLAAMNQQGPSPQQQPTNPSDPASAGGTTTGNNPFAPLMNPWLLNAMNAANNPGNPDAGSIFGNGGGGAVQQPPPADTRSPEERYAEQLRQLNEMGFYEFERNIEALRRTGGSVQGAVEYLLTH